VSLLVGDRVRGVERSLEHRLRDLEGRWAAERKILTDQVEILTTENAELQSSLADLCLQARASPAPAPAPTLWVQILPSASRVQDLLRHGLRMASLHPRSLCPHYQRLHHSLRLGASRQTTDDPVCMNQTNTPNTIFCALLPEQFRFYLFLFLVALGLSASQKLHELLVVRTGQNLYRTLRIFVVLVLEEVIACGFQTLSSRLRHFARENFDAKLTCALSRGGLFFGTLRSPQRAGPHKPRRPGPESVSARRCSRLGASRPQSAELEGRSLERGPRHSRPAQGEEPENGHAGQGLQGQCSAD